MTPNQMSIGVAKRRRILRMNARVHPKQNSLKEELVVALSGVLRFRLFPKNSVRGIAFWAL